VVGGLRSQFVFDGLGDVLVRILRQRR
jgi:hypothetical protein